MDKVVDNSVILSEERYKESVYNEFDHRLKLAGQKVDKAQDSVNRGSFDDHDAFMVYGSLSGAEREWNRTDYIIKQLYKTPYFSHIEMKEKGEDEVEHYYLSDCENLEETVPIGDDGWLLPFKQDKEKPITAALFHCYQSKKGEPITYFASGGKITLNPQLICNDEINARKLIDAVQLFPETKEMQIIADEFLEKKLKENRNSPRLKNIISTLQQMQFQIIDADIRESFVVQGCAGSGKSQCLLHRLFFLRDFLSDRGWEHVLLLTPTKLFRSYSAGLVRRYQLSDVKNCSIAELYRELLDVYDPRFKHRQYQYELSEEYLPAEYLQEVYAEESIRKLSYDIQDAILSYVEEGCEALVEEPPEEITAESIAEIVDELNEEIKAIDEVETSLKKDKQYVEKRNEHKSLVKRLETLQKKHTKQIEELQQTEEKSDVLRQRWQEFKDAQAERDEWLHQVEAEKKAALKELGRLEQRWDSTSEVNLPSDFAGQMAVVRDLFEGDRRRSAEEYTQFLNDYCASIEADVKEIVKKQTPEKVLNKYETRTNQLLEGSRQSSAEIEEVTNAIEECEAWLRSKTEEVEGAQSEYALQRSELEKSSYVLSRIESTLFERVVWDRLAPIKQKYGVQDVETIPLADGHQREIRILYKSDLLFYLKIYAELYPDKELPDYSMICIDEGQDLHRADYDMLHRLYPKAVFNVFGDTDQVLHTACGIHNWKAETGINTEYTLNRNYRNTAPIVDFCNRKFGSAMEYLGSVSTSDQLDELHSIDEVTDVLRKDDITLIVKDHKALEQLCSVTGMDISEFEYLDTRAEQKNGTGIPCYSIFAAKGLEFTSVLVYAHQMTKNQNVVACTRAMKELYYYA